ncbi:MAG: beta-N-acetylhexosaminidase [Alphaproteobacteria bacterium]|nr:beta-N-acetylhexosaminidase [Alphaproteobacteria bacterium]
MSNNAFSGGASEALAAIFSLSGPVLTENEISLFREANPFGFILFARNCKDPAQLKALVRSLKETVGRDCPVLIDQEGGRVQRLRPPHWRSYSPMKYYGDLYGDDPEKALEEIRFETFRMAEELAEAGLNVTCAPVLDLLFDGAHDIIGDRSFSGDPDVAARLGLSVCRNLLRAGVTPVIKHIPGHGRARADSHLALPRVEAPRDHLNALDFEPFRQVAMSEVGAQVWAMSAHILYPELDEGLPATLSSKIIGEVIRSDIGFDGILVGDDLDMKALDAYGDVSERALISLKAGCDLALYCAGEMANMVKLAESLPKVSPETLKRLQNAEKSGKVAA